MRAGYRLAEGPPTVADYLLLRELAGLSPKRQAQAEAALGGSWAAVHVVHEAEGTTVGIGRVLGDGGWYFHMVDLAVLPEHQRRGIGDAILTAVLERIRREAPPGAFVNLIADPPARKLYARHGFEPTAPGGDQHGDDARRREALMDARLPHRIWVESWSRGRRGGE